MASGYYDSLPASFREGAFVGNTPLKNYDFGKTIDPKFTGGFGIDASGQFNQVAENLTGLGALASNQAAWTFITAPEDISWDIANNAQRVDIFGTNNPPVVAGSRGMRDLTLSNALVEGFMRGTTIEGKVAALEQLMNYGLNSSEGFVSVPVYRVKAADKTYGGDNGFFIIKDVKVKETMRDTAGQATRAYVDISLMQVPAYQVNSGRDMASEPTAGVKSGLIDATSLKNGAGGGTLGAGQNGSRSGAGVPGSPGTGGKPPQGNKGGRGSASGDQPGTFGQLAQPTFRQ